MGERIKQSRIISNWNLADQVYEMELEGDSSWITHPGQFLNVTIDNAYHKRPIRNSRANGWNVWLAWATASRRKSSMKKRCCWLAGASACRRSTGWRKRVCSRGSSRL